ncbi:MAG: excinuclease ABC subunit UvrC [Candidatus Zixiibacteriota bacterium]
MPEKPYATKLKNLPRNPGVYLMKDKSGKIIYIGKAKILNNRVRTYFQNGQVLDPKTRALISKIHDFEFLVTDTEMEAMILESNLIKQHKPRYNVNLKDDKRYPYVKVTTDEPYPRILIVRRLYRDKARYFGPFTNVTAMRRMVRFITRLFKIRTCSLTIPHLRGREQKVCLEYRIKRCPGPCENLISVDEYRKQIDCACMYLSGRSEELVQELNEKMKALSAGMDFEGAAEVRDQIRAIESVRQKQKVAADRSVDRDVIAFARSARDAACVILQVREGILIGKQNFYLKIEPETTDSELTGAFVKQYYMYAANLPEEVYLSNEIEDGELVREWLSERLGKQLKLMIPQRGEKLKLVDMAAANAKLVLDELLVQKQGYKKRVGSTLLKLQQDLRLEKTPMSMACIDISNLGETDKVGSLVYFVNGKPRKSQYRHFKIKTVVGQDDFASVREVVTRYYTRLIEETKDGPDLLVIDGGRGQLSAALEVFNELNLDVKVIGLAKRLEEIVMPYQKDTLIIPKSSPSLRILQKLRNEAHRFAIEYHRKLRGKRTIATELEQIEGIGPNKAKKLLKHFKSVTQVRKATVEQISKLPGIGIKDAEHIKAHFVGK